jgi:hypothetical protein
MAFLSEARSNGGTFFLNDSPFVGDGLGGTNVANELLEGAHVGGVFVVQVQVPGLWCQLSLQQRRVEQYFGV